MGTFVAGSHELSPSINYLLHNKILSGQIFAPASQVANGSAPILMSRQRGGPSDAPPAGSSNGNPAAADGERTATTTTTTTTAAAAATTTTITTTNEAHRPRPPTSQATPNDQNDCNGKDHNGSADNNGNHVTKHHFRQVSAVPPMPPIKSSSSAKRLAPLTIEEYEQNFRDSATDLELVERIFYGGMESNQLRAALWPYLFGLTKRRGRFRLIKDSEGQPLDYVYIEHEENLRHWQELERLYYSYESQWKSIMPDQELRFSTFRERKSLIERDVIRSDRTHPFYSDASKTGNLPAFTTLLMTYMMYDFDIGYLQGMSDLAAPILFAFNGNLVKSFWIFVEVMKLFRRNFEFSQKTIHFQLNCLFRLIKMTDPKFAQHLNENECSNCFFAFRCIVCQFKRELMKNEDESNYTKVLSLWDTIWSVQRRHELLSKSKYVHTFTIARSNNHPATTHNHPQHKYHKSRHYNHHRHHHHQSSSLHPFTNRQYGGCNSSAASSAASTPPSSSSPLSPLQPNSARLNGNPSHHHSNTNGNSSSSNNNNNNNGNNYFQNGLSKTSKCRSVVNGLSSSCTGIVGLKGNGYTGNGIANGNANKMHQSSPSPILKSKGSSPAVCTATTNGTAMTNENCSNGTTPVSFANGHHHNSTPPTTNNNNSSHHNHYHYNHQNGNSSSNNNRWDTQSPLSRSPMSTHSNGCYSNDHYNAPLLLLNTASASSSANGHPHQHSQTSHSLKTAEGAEKEAPVKQEQVVYTKETFYSSFDPNQADIPRFELTETEKFVLSLCLSMIRRERNQTLQERLDATEIHQHFINPRLTSELDSFIENAYHIYHFLNTDCDMQLLVKGANELDSLLSANGEVGPGVSPKEDTADTYDLLRDYLIISPSSYGTSKYKYSVSQKSWDHFLNNAESPSSLTD